MKQQAAQAETTGRQYTDLEREVVNYIFHKIAVTWGDALYAAHIGTEGELRVKKRDWASDLLTALNCRRWATESEDEWAIRARDKVDGVFTEIRFMLNEPKWEFPSLKKVCGHMANYRTHAAHREFRKERLLVDKGAQERAQKAGEKALADMKKLMGIRA